MTIKEIQRRRENGASLELLADLAGCTLSEMREALENLGYVIDPSEMEKKVNYTFDTDLALSLYDQGYSDGGIAERMGLARYTIWKWRTNEGIPTKHGGHLKRVDNEAIEALYREGLRPHEICSRLGINKMAYHRWRTKRGLPSHLKGNRTWCVEEAMRLYEQGYNDREIGEQVGASRQSIYDWRSGKGLPANGRKRVLR